MRVLFDQGTPAPTTTSWPRIQLATLLVLSALHEAADRRYVEVVVP